MTTFKGEQGDRICAKLPENIKAILLYGPNNSLIRERAEKALLNIVEDLSDTFRVAILNAANILKDPALLMDELAALSLGGGRRAVWLQDANENISKYIEDALDIEFGDTFFVIESNNLTPRSTLRKVFEGRSELAAVPCYEDDRNSLRNYILDLANKEKIAINPDALEWLLDNVSNDRMQVRNELEKLATYASGRDSKISKPITNVTLECAIACSGDSSIPTLDKLTDSVVLGEIKKIDKLLRLVAEDGLPPISVLRTISKRFIQLHFVVGSLREGGSRENLISSLRPPIFYKNRHSFTSQTRIWTVKAISQALELLTEAEIHCKTTGIPSREICERTLMRIGTAAQRRARNH